jgi:uncharacterized protein YeeX (DUF496 family)
MPDTNVRYPLVAIPKCVFSAIAQDIAEDHTNPYAIVSVNEYIQTFLDHSPMYDYLLAFRKGEKIFIIGDPNTDNDELMLKKVRVTKAQFELLRHRQEQYARDGLRISVSAIVAAMLYQYSKRVRDAIHKIKYPAPWEKELWELIACTFSDGKVEPLRRSFFQKEEQEWKTFYFIADEQRTSPNVIVGWHPRKRSLSEVNFEEF